LKARCWVEALRLLGLEDTARGRLTGFIVNDSIIVDNVGKVRINWG